MTPEEYREEMIRRRVEWNRRRKQVIDTLNQFAIQNPQFEEGFKYYYIFYSPSIKGLKIGSMTNHNRNYPFYFESEEMAADAIEAAGGEAEVLKYYYNIGGDFK